MGGRVSHFEDAGPEVGLVLPTTDGGRYLCRDPRPLPIVATPADVLLLFDRSGSMNTEFGGSTRYAAAAALLGDLVGAYQGRLRFGFQAFPGRRGCASSASPGCCVERPSVPIGLGHADLVREAIEAAAPVEGNTPTAGALRQARQYFQALGDDIKERYVLLATDGRPSCDIGGRLVERDELDADGRRVAGPCFDALQEVRALGDEGVQVIVLGVGPGLEMDPGGRASCLGEMAQLGGAPRPGGQPAFYAATNPAELEWTLQQIFGAFDRPSCLIELKAMPPLPEEVAVFLDGHEIPRSRAQGWDFDGDTKRIRITGLYCRKLERFQVAVVEVRHGCPPCTDPAQCE